MIADRNRRQRRKPRRTGGGATCPSDAPFGDYDHLDRLTTFQRGELNASKAGITGTPAREEDWSLDMTGNWPGFVQKTSGTADLEQGRTHNPVNEITAIAAATGTDWADPMHDRNGNMTTIPKPANLADGLTATDDAWNRLVEVKDGQTVIARYEYLCPCQLGTGEIFWKSQFLAACRGSAPPRGVDDGTAACLTTDGNGLG